MAENTSIEWAKHTFNPWIGCTKVSPACDNCYAEAWDNRFHGNRWGPKALRTRTSNSNWKKPLKWDREAKAAGERHRVFCASLADIFDNHKSIDPTWRHDLWRLIKETPNLIWMLLTKRPQNIKRFLPPDWGDGYPNVWLGTTVENQPEADRRVPVILEIPAVLRFLSMEPLLSSVDLTAFPDPSGLENSFLDALQGRYWMKPGSFDWPTQTRPENGRHYVSLCRGLNWIICGFESGPNYRHGDLDHARSLRDQCALAHVPFLFKQHEASSQKQIKAKGRELDGVIHDGYPIIGSAA